MVLRRTLTVVNQRGLHARASAKFVGAVATLPDETKVWVAKDGHQAAGGSILGLMMLGAARGDQIEVVVDGGDEAAVMDELASLVTGGFGEE